MNDQKHSSERSSRALYLRLLKYVVPYWRVFALAIMSMAIAAASEPAFPALLQPLLDGSFIKKDETLITLMPLLLILLFVIRGIVSYVSSVSMAWIASKVVADLREAMFRHLIQLPTRFYDNTSSGNLIANIAFNVTEVTNAATTVITVVVKDSLTIIGLLGWIFYLNWKLSLIILATTPIIAFLVKTFSKRLRQLSRKTQDTMGEITHVLEEAIQCHKVVKIFGGQPYEFNRFLKAITDFRHYQIDQVKGSAASVPIIQLLIAIALAIIVYIATLQNAENQTTVGGFISFLTAMLMLFAPLKRLTDVNTSLQKGLAAAEKVFNLLDIEKEHELPHAQILTHPLQGKIEFRHVTFTYDGVDRHALQNITLTVRSGETVALVGASGSGKTTLVNLLPRFYNIKIGEILIDDENIQTLRLEDLRKNIALVSQDVVLFNDSIKANIAYGSLENVSDEAVIAAAKAAHAWDFIQAMPDGLSTLIGENGVRLSGGQRQRLAIARAILKNSPILILDEATSALDTESERHVQAALDNLMQSRTTLVIAHRLSTIENADRIVVMQQGQIAEIGTHAALLAQNGIYAQLHRMQFHDA